MDERRYPGHWTGNVATEPKFQITELGTAMLSFRLAENVGTYDDAGTWHQSGTNWYDVVVWGDHANRLNELLRKGDAVDLRGEIRVSQPVGDDGKQHVRVRIIADKVLPDWTRMTVQIDRTTRHTADHATRRSQEVAVDPKAPPAAAPTQPVGMPPMKEWPMPAHPDAGLGL